MFHVIEEDGFTNNFPVYDLVGIVCYYGRHYSTFFFHSQKRVWISFDDAHVTEVKDRAFAAVLRI